jgi:hypothetical protein
MPKTCIRRRHDHTLIPDAAKTCVVPLERNLLSTIGCVPRETCRNSRKPVL